MLLFYDPQMHIIWENRRLNESDAEDIIFRDKTSVYRSLVKVMNLTTFHTKPSISFNPNNTVKIKSS